MNLECKIAIQAPPEAVWAVMTDVDRWPEWTASVIGVRRLDPGPLRVGSAARIWQPAVPSALWRVSRIDPAPPRGEGWGEGRTWSWESGGAGFHMVGHHRVESGAGGTTEATLMVEAKGIIAVLLWPWLRGVSQRYLALEATGLKRRCESG